MFLSEGYLFTVCILC